MRARRKLAIRSASALVTVCWFPSMVSSVAIRLLARISRTISQITAIAKNQVKHSMPGASQDVR
ncbi:MAG TPA: hypothetical protein VE078_16080 [Thermoanaerobaculia bacterium]|nr:hypothetical protein [Thermoanaerobaculia bacterium]